MLSHENILTLCIDSRENSAEFLKRVEHAVDYAIKMNCKVALRWVFVNACLAQNVELAALLLWKTINTDLLDYNQGLDAASQGGSLELVSLLIDYFDANNYEEAFTMACITNNFFVMTHLLDKHLVNFEKLYNNFLINDALSRLSLWSLLRLSKSYNMDISGVLRYPRYEKKLLKYKSETVDIISQVLDRDAANYCVEFI
jgi:hypothetical protein